MQTQSKNNPKPLKKLITQLDLNNSSYLITQPSNLFYLFDLPFFPDDKDLIALIQNPQKIIIFASPLIKLAPIANVTIYPLSKLFSTINRLKSSRLYTEPSINLNLFFKLKPKSPQISPHLEKTLSQLRSTKTKSEIKLVTQACNITKQTMSWAKTQLKPSITEKQLAHSIKQHMLYLGADDWAFPPLVAFGSNTASPHHFPTNKKFSPSQIALIDIGAKFQNYTSDMTRTYLPQKSSKLMSQVKKTVDQSYKHAIKALASNCLASQIDEVCRKTVQDSGFNPYPHSTGHGLGLEIHESPSLSPKSPQSITSNQVITLEPAIYIPNKFGYRYENTILTTGSKPIELT